MSSPARSPVSFPPLPARTSWGRVLPGLVQPPDAAAFERGRRAAHAQAGRQRVGCWLLARQLADDAVYGGGLSVEQQGYAQGLEEAFPQGAMELTALLDPRNRPAGPDATRVGTERA